MNHDRILEALSDAVVVADTSTGRILDANPAAGSLFGVDRAQLMTLTVHELVPEDVREVHRRHVEHYQHAPERRDITARGILYAAHSSGRRIPVAVSLSPTVIDERTVTVALIRDLSQLMAVEQRRQEEASRRLELEVRLAIARDLHDSVIQQLFAAGASLAAASRRVATEAPTVDEGGGEDLGGRLASVADLIDGAIVSLRDAVAGHGPAATRAVGSLADSVVGVVAEMSPALGAVPEVVVSSDLPDALPDGLVVDVGHVVREALANVARHARARSAGVSVAVERISSVRLVVTVWDDGVGAAAAHPLGNGLANVAARAARHGGTSVWRSRRDGGSELRWEVPFDDSAP